MNGGRIPIVGVMGSGTEPHEDKALPLGRWLAELGVHVLTGGGNGVMETVSRAFCGVVDRSGHTIGVLPQSSGSEPSRTGYPNPWIEIPIFTHLPLSGTHGTDSESRNHINILSSDVIVALPGSLGTSSEVHLAVHYGKPIIAYIDRPEEIPEFPRQVPIGSALAEIQAFVRGHLSA